MPVRRFADGEEATRWLPAGAEEVVLVEGPGVAGAKNYGARSARGEVLVFTDDDSRLSGDLGWFQGRPAGESFWCAELVDGTGGKAARNVAAMNVLQERGNFLGCNGSFQAVRRWAFDAVGGFDRRSVYEDVDLSRRLTVAGYRVRRCPITVTVMRAYAEMDEAIPRRAGEAVYGVSGPFLTRVLRSRGPM